MKKGPQRSPRSFLIADSGSSKTDWAWVKEGAPHYFRTDGINPFFNDAQRIEERLKEGIRKEGVEEVERVHFYGAGCASEFHKERVHTGLNRIFADAEIEVEHDLLAAARASAGEEPGLVAILGTGSNACSYDGERILEESGGLGYVLGDEGSGAHLGKLLLRDHLDGELPEAVENAFRSNFSEERADIIEELHRGKDPSRYLASFAPFLKEHEEQEWVRTTVSEAFREFLERHVLRLQGAQGAKLHTVGSIGYHFRPFLEALATEMGLHLGWSITDVVRGLVEYHGRS